MDTKKIGEFLKVLRKERGLTQEQLAESIGITSNTVSRIERGQLIPALPTLVDICNVLKIGANTILFLRREGMSRQ